MGCCCKPWACKENIFGIIWQKLLVYFHCHILIAVIGGFPSSEGNVECHFLESQKAFKRWIVLHSTQVIAFSLKYFKGLGSS